LAVGVAVVGTATARQPTTGFGEVRSIRPSDRVFVLVELSRPPAVAAYHQKKQARGMVAATAAAVSQLGLLRADHAGFRATLAAAGIPGIREVYSLQRVFNGIAYRTTRDQMATLRKLPGVREVHELKPQTLSNADAVPFTGVPAAWENLGLPLHGEGMKIGIMDTGIDYTHAAFGGPGDPAAYLANDPTIIEPGTFPTAKVAGGFDFAGAMYDSNDPDHDIPVPDPDPLDFNGHGSHVSATVAGFGVGADGTTYDGPYDATAPFRMMRIGPGVAPRASLYVLKVMGDKPEGGSSSLLMNQAIEWAVDPNGDGDFSDHLDVVNISMGSAYGSSADPEFTVYRFAVQAGVIVVAAAGNSFDVNFVAGPPAAAPEVIAVGAGQHDRSRHDALQVDSPASIAGSKDIERATFAPGVPSPISGQVVIADPINGCDAPFVNATAIAGNVAVLRRGDCDFEVKALNAQQAGAIAVIVVNNVPGAPIVMSGSADFLSIPVVMLGQDDGEAVIAVLTVGGSVTITLGDAIWLIHPEEADDIADFSSRGPGRLGDQAILKPDVVAPGASIMSVAAGTGNGGAYISGTSMASPHVAGVMALLKQYHPTWTPDQLKALVMNTAVHDLFLKGPEPRSRVSPARSGAGRVDVQAALGSAVIAYDLDAPERVSLSFATIDVVGTALEARTIRLHNIGTAPATYELSLDEVTAMPGVSIQLPATTTFTLPPGGFVDVPVILHASADAMIRTRGVTVSETAEGMPRYWLAEHSGYLVFQRQDLGATSTLRVPYFVAPTPASSMRSTGPLVTTGRTGTASLALTGQGVANTDIGGLSAGVRSLVTPFELLYTSPELAPVVPDPAPWYDPGNTGLPDTRSADIKYLGVASDYVAQGGVIANTSLWFALVTHGRWGSPNAVQLGVKLKRRAAADFEFALMNTDLGLDTLRGSMWWDLLFSVLQNRAANVSTPINWLNGMAPDGLFLPVFLADAMVLEVPAAMLGLTDTDTELEIGGFGFSPVGADTTPLLHYNVARPGFSVPPNGELGLPPGFAPFQVDADGQTLPVSYDLDAAYSNRSGGLLLVHHLNAGGTRGEVVPVVGLTCKSDADCSAPDRRNCDALTGICVGCVDTADCLAGEVCDAYLRACASKCSDPGANACGPGSYCNQAGVACVNDCGWTAAMPCAVGSYCYAATGLCIVANSLTRVTDEAAGANCAAGGVRIDTGIDNNGDLVLDEGEVISSGYVCNGLVSLVSVVDQPEGPICPSGGQRIRTGVDANGDGTLQDDEVGQEWIACNGLEGLVSLVKVTDEAAGATCVAGGSKIETGIDQDGNGVLDASEVQDTHYVCGGVEGRRALSALFDEAPGMNCVAGGKKVIYGIDDSGDGVLQADEIDGIDYVCNGIEANPALVATSAIPAGEQCVNGGTQVQTGIDDNRNGVLDLNEVQSTSVICSGRNGSGCSMAAPADLTPIAGLLLLFGLTIVRRRR
jgi:subtilisin family serine protease